MFKYNPSLCSFSLQLIFFAEKPFYGNYSTLDSHINTVISHMFTYLSRWRRKPWQGLLCGWVKWSKSFMLHNVLPHWSDCWCIVFSRFCKWKGNCFYQTIVIFLYVKRYCLCCQKHALSVEQKLWHSKKNYGKNLTWNLVYKNKLF